MVNEQLALLSGIFDNYYQNFSQYLYRVLHSMSILHDLGFDPYIKPLFSEIDIEDEGDLEFLVFADYQNGFGESARLNVKDIPDWLILKAKDELATADEP